MLLAGLSCFFLFASETATAKTKTISVTRPTGGSFAIPSTEGFLTSRDLLGKQIFLFFGFTTCPDICPLTLQTMKQVAQALSPTERDNFRFLFVSVDPEVDTLERLKALKSEWGPNYIGATNSEASLRKLANQFGAFFKIFKTHSGKRIVSHTDSIFHINREGVWMNTLPYGTSVETFLKQLRSVDAPAKSSIPSSRTAVFLAENTACDLGKSKCEIKMGEEAFELNFEAKPIRTEKKFTITLKTQSMQWKPTEIDFEGVSTNMGYLRPALQLVRPKEYEAALVLPICDIERMDWRVKVILENPKKELGYLGFRLQTLE